MLKLSSAVNTPVDLKYDQREIDANHLGFRANTSNSLEKTLQNDVYQKPKKTVYQLVL